MFLEPVMSDVRQGYTVHGLSPANTTHLYNICTMLD